MMKKLLAVGVIAAFLVMGCETNPSSASARQCQHGIKKANKELGIARSKGFSGAVEITKAVTLLTGASIQYEFGKYPNCIDKVKRARRFIRNAKK